MEGAGLALGVIAIAGIFNDCKDLLACFLAAKSMSDDYDELVIIFSHQRMFLDNWAKRTSLFDRQNYDKRLDEPRVSVAVSQSLRRIFKLLKDGEELQKRYGLEPAKTRSISRFREISRKFRSAHGPQQLQLEQHVRVGQPMSRNNENKNSVVQKFTWVIKDKERFEGLLKSLKTHIDCINDAVPPLSTIFVNASLQNKIEEVHPVDVLKTIEEIPAKENNNTVYSVSQTLDPKCIKRVLDRLWFRFIEDRKNSIEDAHFETFEWAIRSPGPGSNWNDLRQWLRSGNDIYWIYGKPGSGKSTLMKYLFGHPKASELLEEWSGDQKLTVAAFFLWNVGTPEQNTQHGLARGLLYHVLKENESLIPVVLPDMWREVQTGNMDVKPPSGTELDQAFQQLGRESAEGVFAFFIDGIDEFKGNHQEGISFIKKLATSVRIKILLSSRETNECNAAFSTKPKMRLQDLTKTDIERYVSGTIRTHLSLSNTSYLSERDTHELIERVQQKAQGVFLWVVLACRTLRDHMDARDKAEKLCKVVEELPPELEDLFRSILESVPRDCRQEAAKLLRICYLHTSKMSHRNLNAFSLAWAYEKEMSLDQMQDFTRFSHDEIIQKSITFEAQLRSRCRGLLEIYGDKIHDNHRTHIDTSSRIDFMHRTVFEFLNSPAAVEMECLKVYDDEFDPAATLAYMYTYEMYFCKRYISKQAKLKPDIFDPLEIVSECSPSKKSLQLLHKVVSVLMEPWEIRKPETAAENTQLFPICLCDNTNRRLESFLGCPRHVLPKEHAALILAVETGLYDCVKASDVERFNAWQESQHLGADNRRNLLFHAIGQPIAGFVYALPKPCFCSSDIIETLIDSGCDPNQIVVREEGLMSDSVTTPWQLWLDWLRWGDPNISICTKQCDRVSKCVFVTTKMLEVGADLYPSIFTSLGDLRVYLSEEVMKWVKAAQKIDSEELRHHILDSCMVISRAICSSLSENPEFMESDYYSEDEVENYKSEDIVESEDDVESEEYNGKDQRAKIMRRMNMVMEMRYDELE